MKIYGYSKCSTVKKAKGYIDRKKMKYDFIDMVEDGISQKVIKEIDKLVGDIEELINKRSTTYRELKLKDKWEKMTKAEKIKTLVNNPKLIKRPIVVKGKKVLVGFDQKLYKTVLVDGKAVPKKDAKKTVAKKQATKKAATKKATAKKTTSKKAATKKVAAKKVAAKKTTKKSSTKKNTKKTVAKKTSAKKSNKKK